MPHFVAFHLGLHCLPKYPFRGFQYTSRVNPLSASDNLCFLLIIFANS